VPCRCGHEVIIRRLLTRAQMGDRVSIVSRSGTNPSNGYYVARFLAALLRARHPLDPLLFVEGHVSRKGSTVSACQVARMVERQRAAA
jgi:hypothetical protein